MNRIVRGRLDLSFELSDRLYIPLKLSAGIGQKLVEIT